MRKTDSVIFTIFNSNENRCKSIIVSMIYIGPIFSQQFDNAQVTYDLQKQNFEMSDFDAKQCQIIKIIPSLQAVKIGVRPFPSGTFSSTFCEMRVFINLTSPEMNFHH